MRRFFVFGRSSWDSQDRLPMIWNENRPGVTVCCIPRSVSSERVPGWRMVVKLSLKFRFFTGDLKNIWHKLTIQNYQMSEMWGEFLVEKSPWRIGVDKVDHPKTRDESPWFLQSQISRCSSETRIVWSINLRKKKAKMVQKQKKDQEMVSSQDFSQSLVKRLAVRSTLESATFHMPDGVFIWECWEFPNCSMSHHDLWWFSDVFPESNNAVKTLPWTIPQITINAINGWYRPSKIGWFMWHCFNMF